MLHLVLLMYAIMGFAFAFGKLAISYTTVSSPAYVIAFRMIPMGLVSIFLSFNKESNSAKFEYKDLIKFALVGLFAVYLHLVPEYWSLNYLDSVKACLIYSFNPFIAAFLSYILVGQLLNKKEWIGLALGFAGMIPIMMTGNGGEAGLGSLCKISTPELAMFLSTFALAYAWFLIKPLAEKGYSLMFINGMSMLFGGFFSLAHFCYFNGLEIFPVASPAKFIGISLLLILVSNITTYNLYGYLLKHYSLTFLSLAGFTLPIFSGIYGYLIFGENWSWLYAVGLGFITIGLAIYYRGSLEKEKTSLL
jgi:drug/metabolite transporter (DMT)-like permease